MGYHFDRAEFSARAARATAEVSARGLDGVLLFAPESHYWLTGYDTFGFAMFQCMVLRADGDIRLLTRAPDLRQARFTSILPDAAIRIWATCATFSRRWAWPAGAWASRPRPWG
jgi:Xaa-Pro dipeptidase